MKQAYRAGFGMVLALLNAFSGAAARGQDCSYVSATENFNSIAYCVSSVLPATGGNAYGPENLFDGHRESAWCEGARGAGMGEVLTLRIDGGGPFRRIMIESGYQKSREIFERNARPMAVEVRTDTGLRFIHVLDDAMGEQMIELPKPDQYGVVQLRILDVYYGSRYEDMCISTVLVDFDYEKYLEFQEDAVAPEQRKANPAPSVGLPGKPSPLPEKLPELPKL